MSEEKIARFYDESRNPEGGMLPGVPLADITEERWATLPAWLQASVDALPCYRKTPPPRESAPLKGASALARSDDVADGQKE